MALSKKGKALTQKMPKQPGVYQMKDREGNILYIGKAKDLKKRVTSYFDPRVPHDPFKSEMIRFIEQIDIIVTTSEEEGLVLEANLVKQHQPRYNINLKDGKHYPYIKLTTDEYPAISIVRNLEDRNARYYGPFPSGLAVRQTVKFLVAAFKVRECKSLSKRGCVKSSIGLCSAPCTHPEENRDYKDRVRLVDAILRGRTKGLMKRLKAIMRQRTKEQRFEEAAKIRDLLGALEGVSQQQGVELLPEGLTDIISIGKAPDGSRCILIFKVRDGRVHSESYFFVEPPAHKAARKGTGTTPAMTASTKTAGLEPMDASILGDFIEHYYTSAYIPRKLVTPPLPDRLARDLERELGRLKGSEVTLVCRPTGRTARLLGLAGRNAQMKLLTRSQTRRERPGQVVAQQASQDEPGRELIAIRDALGLPNIPYRIEAFDVSNIQGDSPVGSMVAFQDGIPLKSDYRHYMMHTLGINDFEMIAELVTRRYSKHPLPDLILIDGGKQQLEFALRALNGLGLKAHGIVGLAKQNEELWLPGRITPVVLDRHDEGLRLLQRARDEAHRFAVTFHRKKRSERTIISELDRITGLGTKRRTLLLQRFGSVERIKKCSIEELLTVPGLGHSLAKRVLEELKKAEKFG